MGEGTHETNNVAINEATWRFHEAAEARRKSIRLQEAESGTSMRQEKEARQILEPSLNECMLTGIRLLHFHCTTYTELAIISVDVG